MESCLLVEPYVNIQRLYSIGSQEEVEKFLLSNSLEQSAQFIHPKEFYAIESQPEPFQRKSYPNSKRKEFRYFKPQLIRITPIPALASLIEYGTAVMQIVDELLMPVEAETMEMSEMNEKKCFCFNPTANKTSKGKQYRLRFTVNFELVGGEQKTETLYSSKFRIVSRISETQKSQTKNLYQ